jgi:hypothetical protein
LTGGMWCLSECNGVSVRGNNHRKEQKIAYLPTSRSKLAGGCGWGRRRRTSFRAGSGDRTAGHRGKDEFCTMRRVI